MYLLIFINNNKHDQRSIKLSKNVKNVKNNARKETERKGTLFYYYLTLDN